MRDAGQTTARGCISGSSGVWARGGDANPIADAISRAALPVTRDIALHRRDRSTCHRPRAAWREDGLILFRKVLGTLVRHDRALNPRCCAEQLGVFQMSADELNADRE